jgi:Fe-S oxidoreductase
MALDEYRRDMAGCSRCSSCKWVPFNQMKSWRFAKNCPSITRYNFHAYSGSGKMNMGLSMLEGRSELTDTVADIIYHCNLCGACDTACKVYRDDIDLGEVLEELRAFCVEEGRLLPEHMALIDALKKENNVFGEPKAERGAWADGMGLKDINTEKADVIFHAGCRFSYDQELWGIVRGAVRLMQKAGADIGIGGREEACCGGRAFELGYRGEMLNFADDMNSRVRASGATTLVTGCSDCYSAFKYLYDRVGKKLPVEVLHITEYLDREIQAGKLRLSKSLPMLVTYHDPCHLGRRSEPYLGNWQGDKLLRPMTQKRTGRKGIYGPPREVLGAIPGLELTEMERIKEYAWCCGAGGGVMEAFPDFSAWTAHERLEEAQATGADALVTACPWCQRSFRDALSANGTRLELYDLTELVLQSAGG